MRSDRVSTVLPDWAISDSRPEPQPAGSTPAGGFFARQEVR